MRRVDWLIIVFCLVGSLVTASWAFLAGVVQGRKEITSIYRKQIRALELVVNHEAIKADLREGRYVQP